MPSPELYSEVERTSKGKRHCTCCCRLIHAGVRYKDCSGKADGDWFSCAVCLPCMTLYVEIRRGMHSFDAEEFAFVDLDEVISDSENVKWIERWAAIRENGTVTHA
jgi:hypothetical protein